MKNHTLAARSLPLDDSWDVIVVGGGPTGCTAAIAAAREGARTLLIEATGVLGGCGTSALVPAWCPFSDKEKIIYRGLAETVFNACKKGMAHVGSGDLDWVPIDPEKLKGIYDKMVTEAGATVLFNTVLSAVEKEDEENVSALIISNKAGLSALRAKVYIDCTGDADLAAWAGAEFNKGDENGSMQPGTLCFILANVDEYAYRNGPQLGAWNPNSPIFAIVKSGEFPEIPDTHLCNTLIGPRTVGFNAGHVFGVDNTDPASVSAALIKGRKLAAAFRDALAKYHPAFANAFLVSTASVVGIRETRQIIGDYILRAEDYRNRQSFSDEICRNAYYIDIHLTEQETKKGNVDLESRCQRYEKGESHGVPYRCLTPRGLNNVLVAGRSISCDHVMQGSIRVMPVCLAMGEAAGIAAVAASRLEAVNVHRIDTAKLRQRLIEFGAYLPELPQNAQ